MDDKFPCVRDIAPGENVTALFLVSLSSLKQARNGPFWLLELKDATGSLEARIWNPLSLSFSEIPVGSIVEVEGRTETYRDKIQLSVTKLKVLGPDERAALDMSRFVASSRVSAVDMLAELEALCQSVLTFRPWRVFARTVFDNEELRARLLTAYAARGIHHAWSGGLLEHTLGVVRLCMKLADLYPMLDRQILLVAAAFHDIGKLWELSADLAPDYSDEGRLLGHISIGLEKLEVPLEEAGVPAELALHFKHLILSHHGQLEFGSPRLPQTAEAFALHYADNLDAKLTQCRSLIEELPQGAAWTSYQKSLDRALYRPSRTPEGPSEAVRENRAPSQNEASFAFDEEKGDEPEFSFDGEANASRQIPDFDVMFGPSADEDDGAMEFAFTGDSADSPAADLNGMPGAPDVPFEGVPAEPMESAEKAPDDPVSEAPQAEPKPARKPRKKAPAAKKAESEAAVVPPAKEVRAEAEREPETEGEDASHDTGEAEKKHPEPQGGPRQCSLL